VYLLCDIIIKICKGSDDVVQHRGVDKTTKSKTCIPGHRISFFNNSEINRFYFYKIVRLLVLLFFLCFYKPGSGKNYKKERGDGYENQ